MKNENEIIRMVLDNLKFKSLNKIQESILVHGKKKNDILLLSPTGSGKTVAFLLQLVLEIQPNIEGVQALIIVPSRELALQVEQVFKSMGTGFKVNSSYGGHSIKTEKNNFREAPVVLIGTPGRIADHLGPHARVDLQPAHAWCLRR